LTPLVSGHSLQFYNNIIKENKYTWSSVPWYLGECYFYRRIFDTTNYFQNHIDVFEKGKQESLKSSMDAVAQLTKSMEVLLKQDTITKDEMKSIFYMVLWANKADLSLKPSGVDSSHLLFNVEDDLPNVLIDHTEHLWNYISTLKSVPMDFVIDNCGIDVISDLCLATLLTEKGYASSVTVHIKQDPIFVSDVTLPDFNYTLSQLELSPQTKFLSLKWKQFISDKRWTIAPDIFWNNHLPIWDIEGNLKDKFAKSALVFMKGDALSRRVHGDLRWPFTTPIQNIIKNFPTHLVLLRTLKSETASGLSEEQLKKFESDTKMDWLSTGKYGVIQYVPKSNQKNKQEIMLAICFHHTLYQNYI